MESIGTKVPLESDKYMTKAQRIAHKRGNQERKARNLAGKNPSTFVWKSIQDGKYTVRS